MQQLGASFINSFLLPYIQKQILGNIGNDTRLQNMFRYDKVITSEEIKGLEDYYFADTGTILETDAGLRRAFWKEFSEFVGRQKNLCEGNVLKLAFRILPDEKTGSFSKEADLNLEKFAYYAVNRLEDTLVQREIDQKAVLGKISAAQAVDDRSDLEKGKLILVRQKEGGFDYMSDKTVARAIGNTERTAKMLAALQTEKTEKGERRIYAFNPSEVSGEGEASSSPQEVQELLWKKQSIKSEKQLEDNGIFVEGHMTIDTNGISRGFAKDKNGIRLRVEFDVKKPGERVYRMTFVDNPDNKFFIAENELKKKFGENKQSALEVYREKERAAGRGYGITKARGLRLKDGAGTITLPKDRKITMIVGASGGVRPPEEGVVTGIPYVPDVAGQRRQIVKDKSEIDKENSIGFSGAMDAKRSLEARNKNIREPEIETTASVNGRDTKANRGKVKASRKQKEKSFMWKVAKIYAASIGGAFGLSGLVSLLT